MTDLTELIDKYLQEADECEMLGGLAATHDERVRFRERAEKLRCLVQAELQKRRERAELQERRERAALQEWRERAARERAERERAEQERKDQERRARHEGTRAWWEVLGVDPTATLAEIRASFRKKVQQYHPDLVANLGPEIVELAERHTKEINRAFEEAKRQASAG